jgi:hypothetical protein
MKKNEFLMNIQQASNIFLTIFHYDIKHTIFERISHSHYVN